ncbi:hypothetical protein PVAG01_05250 [Phlyctema vagabunda]|uniref:Rhodopsin family protein n=1 Tax=Phlyctema vagabunda TaxID=108571 RepID=A0ABR4PJW1_9HELO
MCFIFTCGEHEFSSQLKGYESVVCQCHNCVSVVQRGPPVSFPRYPEMGGWLTCSQGNYSGRVIKRHPWFTFCFIPVIPLSVHAYEDVVCTICNFAQPLKNRQDIIAQMNGGGGQPGHPLQNQKPPPGAGGGPPPGWGGGPPGQPPQQQNMQYR